MLSAGRASGVLVVDLDALARNYALLARTVAPAECGAVVKADAYGLGVARVAPRLHAAGCGTFFVATLAEGRELRRLLADARIFVFEGAVAGAERALEAAGLVPVLNTLEQIERWSAAGGPSRSNGKTPPAALHLDTGMTRLGLSASDVARLLAEPGRLAGIDVELVLTHLACADQPEHPLNAAQIVELDRLRALLPEAPTSIGNSAGAFLGAAYRGDIVRAGIALYGGNPFVGRANPVEPVVTLSGRVLQVRSIEAPVTVGYGASYAAAPPARIAVVGVGYADGYPRSLGNRGWAAVGGVAVPIIGRVSMDLMCVDVGALPVEAVREGTYVDLIGPGAALDDVAEAAGTIGYEILTRLGRRLEREYRER